MQNSAVRLKAIKTGGNSMNPTPAMSLNLLSGAISSLVSFTRATPATVTDFEGLIKTVKSGEARFDGMRRVENLLTYSQDFSNAAWSLPSGGATLTSNITAPDSTSTAFNLIATATTGYHYLNFVASFAITNSVATHSIYVKANGYTKVGLREGATGAFSTGFDLSAVSVLYTTAGTTATITSVGNSWYRITATYTAATQSMQVFVLPASYATGDITTIHWVGDGVSSISVWGAQLENVTGQTNQNPSEYISTNVLSYPYQGAGVDGVKYFPYTNPNCVINGAITQIPTTPINSNNSKWAYNCTASGDYFSTPSSTANRITGNLSLLAQVALDDWTPGTVQTLVAKDGVSAGTRSWAFNVQASGVLRLNVSFNGTALFSYDSTVATGFTDRTVHYVGVQREASTGIIKFYTSEDGRTFTQLGSDVAGTAGALYDATTQPVQFGNLSGLSFALDGKIYDSHVYSGLKFTGTSTMVMDFDPSNWTTGTTFTGLETGEVWTLNGNAKIYQGLWDAVGPSSLLIEEQRINLFLNSTSPATQSYTTSAIPYTISFYGSGTITLSGSYVAVVAGSNPYTRTTLTFTPTAASLTMTVTGTITYPQLEAGSFATSAIVTAGSQVTRNADQASMTGTNFSSWYNTNASSIYWEGDVIDISSQAKALYALSDNTITNKIDAYEASGTINFDDYGTAKSSVTANKKFKVGQSLSSTTVLTALNGSVSSTANTMPSGLNRLNLGSNYTLGTNTMAGHVRQFNVYSTALPSAVLQALTS